MSEFAELASRSMPAAMAAPAPVESPSPAEPVAEEPPVFEKPPTLAEAPPELTPPDDDEKEESDERQITIINRVPKTLTNVVKEQFALMDAWLEPIHKATRSNRKDMRKLKDQLDFCLKSYQALLERIERKL